MKKLSIAIFMSVALLAVVFALTVGTTNQNEQVLGMATPTNLQIDAAADAHPVYSATPAVWSAAAATVAATAAAVNAGVNVYRAYKTRGGNTSEYQTQNKDVLMSILDE